MTVNRLSSINCVRSRNTHTKRTKEWCIILLFILCGAVPKLTIAGSPKRKTHGTSLKGTTTTTATRTTILPKIILATKPKNANNRDGPDHNPHAPNTSSHPRHLQNNSYQTFSGPKILLKLTDLSTTMTSLQKNLFEETIKQFIESNLEKLHRVTVKIRGQMAQRRRNKGPRSNEGTTDDDDDANLLVLFSVYGFIEGGGSGMNELEGDIQNLIRERREILKERIYFLHEYDDYFKDVTALRVLDSSEADAFAFTRGSRTGNGMNTTDEAAIFGVMVAVGFLIFLAVTTTNAMLRRDKILEAHLNYSKVGSAGGGTTENPRFQAYPGTVERRSFLQKKNRRSVTFADADDDSLDFAAAYGPGAEAMVRLSCVAPPGSMGVAIRESWDYPVVYDMQPGGPMSDKLRKLDKILAVDDVDTRGMTGDQFTQLLQAKNDYEKTISFLRKATKKEDVGLERLTYLAPPGSMGVAIEASVDYPVVFAMDSSCAMNGKLQVMDKILAVDDIDTKNMSKDEFTELLQTKNDCEKTIHILRKGVENVIV